MNICGWVVLGLGAVSRKDKAYELKEKNDPATKSGGNTRTYTSDFFAELERDALGR